MNRALLVLGALAGLLLATAASATDGDDCVTAGVLSSASRTGSSCVVLCDSKNSAASDCSAYTVPMDFRKAVFKIRANDGCSSTHNVLISHSLDGISDPAGYVWLSADDAGTTTIDERAAAVDGEAYPALTTLTFALTNMTGCDTTGSNEGLEVIGVFWPRLEP